MAGLNAPRFVVPSLRGIDPGSDQGLQTNCELRQAIPIQNRTAAGSIGKVNSPTFNRDARAWFIREQDSPVQVCVVQQRQQVSRGRDAD